MWSPTLVMLDGAPSAGLVVWHQLEATADPANLIMAMTVSRAFNSIGKSPRELLFGREEAKERACVRKNFDCVNASAKAPHGVLDA